MSYLNPFNYLGIYNKSYKSFEPAEKEFAAFLNNVNNWLSANANPTESDVVKHINELLQILNYGNDVKNNSQTQKKSSSHADIEIVRDGQVQVIIETKKISNVNEMPSKKSICSKALYECIWYYYNRKTILETYNIKHFVITDGVNYFFVKPASIAKFSEIEKLCCDYRDGKLSIDSTSYLYKCIEEIIKEKESKIIWTSMHIAKGNINDIKYVYKLMHKNFLLRDYVSVDTNILNGKFYKGLLEIIGLKEVEKSKVLVQSDSKNSLIYGILQSGEIHYLDDAIRLASTWINRLLFLKLFQEQLIAFNNDKSYEFLNQLNTFADYLRLFFSVLGTEYANRESYLDSYSKIPFLNSSLFERIDLEVSCPISFLDGLNLRINGKELPKYIIEFLNSYNFVSNVTSNSSDINPSVLGLIFEKLNGYADGAVFTPAYITEFMTKDTIDRLVISRINDYFVAKGKEPCETIEEVRSLLETCIHKTDVKKAVSNIFDNLKICDPAVGSGHFLVSSLNYLLYLKFYLGIVNLKNVELDIQNDSLITYEFSSGENKQFKYNRVNLESLGIQKALFNEKCKIIKKNLFGVDINPTSVSICKLRLWIELLKNVYYTDEHNMEVLPNLDINVICGNSLISSFKYHLGSVTKIEDVNLN